MTGWKRSGPKRQRCQPVCEDCCGVSADAHLIARQVLTRRRIVTPLLFTVAAGCVVWEVWPGPAAGLSSGINRVDALTIVATLVGLVVLSLVPGTF